MKNKYQVSGMTCGGCRGALVNALNNAGIATEAHDVSVPEGSVEVDGEVSPAKLQAAVETAGFTLGPKLQTGPTGSRE